MEQYAVLSAETHLFFARIMKEHALFLQAGFPCKDEAWSKTADWYREHFEELLKEVWKISEGLVREEVAESCELVTRFTVPAEQRTQELSGISIDSRISEMERKLKRGCREEADRRIFEKFQELNEKAVWLLDGLIDFKQGILDMVRKGKLFNANYPLLIEHIMREAELYRDAVKMLLQNRQVAERDLYGREIFWNQIMMEHALFIRGLLDPSEKDLIRTAEGFAEDYRELLAMAKLQECRASEHLTRKSIEETKRYREFKTAGTEGILECKIDSIILPLLADHVLREANHYLRILESGHMG